jgi:hypothetical protein
MVNPGNAIKFAMGGFTWYGALGFFAPSLCYKLLFKGGLWPGTKKNDTIPEEADVVHAQTARWMGFAVLYDIINTHRLTNGFKDQQATILQNQAGLWAAAALMHIPAQVSKGGG